MRICHITTAHPAKDVRIFHKECAGLAKAGHQVTLLVPNVASEACKDVQIIGVNVPYSGRSGRMLRVGRAMYRAALAQRADAYHFHDPEFLPYAWLMARRGRRVTYDVHEDLPRQLLSKHWIPGPLRRLISWASELFEDAVAARLHAVVAATPLIADRFLKINPHTVTVCNYPLLSELSMGAKDETKGREVCYIGSITAIRGVEQMVRAMEHCSAHLHLAGAWSPESLRTETMKLDGWRHVTDHGFVGREEVWAIYARCPVGLVTLHPVENYIESLPIKLFEYMLAGMAVVASDFPLWNRIITEAGCGLCIDPMDPAAIGQAIDTLLNDPEAARAMGQRGREAVLSHYNWEQQQVVLNALYSA
jgi:glycosyltransferase involved in cell wall biosynthesis